MVLVFMSAVAVIVFPCTLPGVVISPLYKLRSPYIVTVLSKNSNPAPPCIDVPVPIFPNLIDDPSKYKIFWLFVPLNIEYDWFAVISLATILTPDIEPDASMSFANKLTTSILSAVTEPAAIFSVVIELAAIWTAVTEPAYNRPPLI